MITKEEIKGICNLIGDNNLEDCDKININGRSIWWDEYEVGDWIDEGKYQFGHTIWELTEDGNKTGLFLMQEASKCGSYFSHTEYMYEKPYQVNEIEETIVVKKYIRVK